ncbi:MAG: hypothetical protein V4726_00405 [Verrucomicrobiota bacterium]
MNPSTVPAPSVRPLRSAGICGSLTRLILLLAVCLGGLFHPSAARAAGSDPAEKTSAAALYNEGNAAQRLGRAGPAILHYERALQLAPGDPAILHNLQAARGKAGVAAPAVPVWKRPAHWLSFNGTATLGSVSLLLLCLLFFSAGLVPPMLRRLVKGASFLLVLTVLFSAAAVAARWTELDRAIITATESAARIAPAENAAHAFDLKSGELVLAEAVHGTFTRIRAADGRTGWVVSTDLEKILPTAADIPKQARI